ncbi:TetR family transcriptional regulator [Paraliobacillus quinghaiensis]|uniref:TetR family transcriptional regulator n=1 Tax=Paraliobacillus quinghaiensis TaxID=470815 RepID=A0A917WP89_9BACI|nr:TetR/AcrR family transcriptional regulator [Paraliobacillus quinghaiensis]GGM18777.1 TetR family transcriptional regulator [Paraliobacillus quinghaiensis]
MNENFYSLHAEKQTRVINAALKEFVKNGFEKASTNEIVKGAGISKGSLFNYFNNKKDLYFFLIEHSLKVVETIYDEIDLTETDIFNRLEQFGLTKFAIQKKTPQIFDFLLSVKKEEADEVRADIAKILDDTLEEGLGKIYQNIDYSKFREDIDIQRAIEIINWTMIGFAEKEGNVDSVQDIDIEIYKEWHNYSELLRRCFYK